MLLLTTTGTSFFLTRCETVNTKLFCFAVLFTVVLFPFSSPAEANPEPVNIGVIGVIPFGCEEIPKRHYCIHESISRLIAANAGLTYRVQTVPYEEIAAALSTGKIDLAIMLPNSEVDAVAERIEVVYHLDISVYVRKTGTIDSISDLAGKKVAKLRTADYLSQRNPLQSAQWVGIDQFTDGLELLSEGKVDAFIGPTAVTDRLLEQYEGLLRLQQPSTWKRPVWLFCRKNFCTERVKSDLRLAIREIDPDSVSSAIAGKYYGLDQVRLKFALNDVAPYGCRSDEHNVDCVGNLIVMLLDLYSGISIQTTRYPSLRTIKQIADGQADLTFYLEDEVLKLGAERIAKFFSVDMEMTSLMSLPVHSIGKLEGKKVAVHKANPKMAALLADSSADLIPFEHYDQGASLLHRRRVDAVVATEGIIGPTFSALGYTDPLAPAVHVGELDMFLYCGVGKCTDIAKERLKRAAARLDKAWLNKMIRHSLLTVQRETMTLYNELL